MNNKDVWRWNTRASLVYALGVWTMIGSYAFLKYTGRIGDPSEKKMGKPDLEEENPHQKVYETAHTKTIVVYKKDFVPFTDRIYNFFKSFTSDPGSGGSEK